MLNRLGSFDSVNTMVVCDSDLNGIKAQVYRFVRPAGNTPFKNCCTDTTSTSGRKALSYLSNTAGVLNCYAYPDVARRHKSAHNKIRRILLDFDHAYTRETGKTMQKPLGELWQEYLIEHYNRVITWASWWITDRTTLLIPIWSAKCMKASGKGNAFACAPCTLR